MRWFVCLCRFLVVYSWALICKSLYWWRIKRPYIALCSTLLLGLPHSLCSLRCEMVRFMNFVDAFVIVHRNTPLIPLWCLFKRRIFRRVLVLVISVWYKQFIFLSVSITSREAPQTSLSPILPKLKLGKRIFHAKFWASEMAGTFVRVRLKFVLN